MKKCLNCGSEVDSTTKFCGQCGVRIEDRADSEEYIASNSKMEAKQEEFTEPKSRLNKFLIIGVAGVVLLCIALIGITQVSSKLNQNKEIAKIEQKKLDELQKTNKELQVETKALKDKVKTFYNWSEAESNYFDAEAMGAYQVTIEERIIQGNSHIEFIEANRSYEPTKSDYEARIETLDQLINYLNSLETLEQLKENSGYQEWAK